VPLCGAVKREAGSCEDVEARESLNIALVVFGEPPASGRPGE
jgi:hypothetical protein